MPYVRCVTERVIIGNVGGDGRIGPTGRDDPQPFYGSVWKKRGNAVGIWTGSHTTIFIEPVYDQHQPLALASTYLRCFIEQSNKVGISRRESKECWHRLGKYFSKLFKDNIRKGDMILLARETSGDEKRHYTYVRRRMQSEPG